MKRKFSPSTSTREDAKLPSTVEYNIKDANLQAEYLNVGLGNMNVNHYHFYEKGTFTATCYEKKSKGQNFLCGTAAFVFINCRSNMHKKVILLSYFSQVNKALHFCITCFILLEFQNICSILKSQNK